MCGYLVLFVSLFCAAVRGSQVTVKASVGQINGERTKTSFLGKTNEVDRYLGIPYAKAPVGDLRFKKPEPVEPFKQPYDATKYGAVCPQFDYLMRGPYTFELSEDCLFLNVYVPKQEPDEKTGHAVMFFIHGGGFAVGSGNVYRGEVLASEGNVIVVAINYRLGVLGFLDMDDERVPGNYGLWDQHQALQWVNQNIGAFGGDKDRVTIFGESAGSVSVTLQMLFPPNKGLFKNAIAESGTASMPFLISDNSLMSAKNYADAMECNAENNDEILSCLREMLADKPVDILKNAMMNEGASAQFKYVTVPTLDGEFVKRRLWDIHEASRTEQVEEVEFCRSINLMNGVNEAEGALFLMMLGTPEQLEELQISREQMNNELIPGIFAMCFGFGRALPDVVKQMLVSEYTDWSGPDDPFKLRHQLIRLNGDAYFNAPAVAFSLMHANASDAVSYMYEFNAVVGLPLLSSPSWYSQANHGDELGPVFGYNFDAQLIFNLTEYKVPAWELELSSRIMAYWSNFAKSGNPNIPKPSKQSAGPWPRYTVDEQRYMILDKEESTGQFLFARETDFWRKTLPNVLEAVEKGQEKHSPYSDDLGSCQKDGGCDGE